MLENMKGSACSINVKILCFQLPSKSKQVKELKQNVKQSKSKPVKF